ncbi:MAG: hypothetical protein IT384_05895 [Deltaproteobacteria bacterium]|nr:hypothetical protein [Deltaproteobacteria bacterium]
MSDELGRILAALVATTGSPPPADADPEEVIARAEAMLDARSALLQALGDKGVLPADHPQLADISALDERWSVALVQARRELGHRLAAVARLRHRGAHR